MVEKLVFEFTLDGKGNPCLKFRHHDKSNSLEQKVLKEFIRASYEKGLEIVNTSGYMDTSGNSFENYEIRIK